MPDTSSSQSAYLEASVPRITQYVLEVIAEPSTVEPRVTQYALEVLAKPDSDPRITQYALEVLIKPDERDSQPAFLLGGNPNPRLTQVAVEALTQPSTQTARVTQLANEVLVQPSTTQAILTQIVVEVLIKPSKSEKPAFLSGVIETNSSVSAFTDAKIFPVVDDFSGTEGEDWSDDYWKTWS